MATLYDPAQIILKIKSDKVPIEEAFAEVVSFFKSCTDDEGVVLLRLMRTRLDPDKDYLRMERMGELGSNSKDYQTHMIRLFNYAQKNELPLGDISGV